MIHALIGTIRYAPETRKLFLDDHLDIRKDVDISAFFSFINWFEVFAYYEGIIEYKMGLVSRFYASQDHCQDRVALFDLFVIPVRCISGIIYSTNGILEKEMITRDKITQILQDNHAYLTAEFGVKKIGVFGSYAQGTAREDSDIDLMIEFSRPIGFRFMELAEYLEKLLDGPVDILTPAGVEGIRVSKVAAEIQESVVYV